MIARSSQYSSLGQALSWAVSVSTLITIGYVIGWFVFPVPQLLLVAADVAAVGILLLLALWFSRKQYTYLTIVFIGLASAMATFVSALILPETGMVLILFPILLLVFALPYVSARMMRLLSLIVLISSLILAWIVRFTQLFEPLPKHIFDIAIISNAPLAMSVIVLLLWQFYTRMNTLLQESQSSNVQLQELRSALEVQVIERTRDLHQALEEVQRRAAEQAQQYVELEQQRSIIRELSVPVLPLNTTTLVMPLIGVLDRERLEVVQQRALQAIEQSRVRRLLLDITGVPIIDHAIAQGLIGIVQAGHLLGTEIVLVGIRPEVAQAIVGLGIELRSIKTSSNLQTALQVYSYPR